MTSRLGTPSPCASAELRWLRAVAEAAPLYRDSVIEATRGLDLVPQTTDAMMRAKAKLEGALNELRIARETKEK